MRILALAGLVVTLSAPVWAQAAYRRHYVSVGTGAGLPRADLRTAFSTSPGLNVGYGFRFHPWFQLDAGFETLFGAAGVRDFLPTAFGNLRIRDYQHFVPFGGRVVVPLLDERLHLFAGGGGAYMRYTERIRQPCSDCGFRIECDVCSARDGWGGYGLAGANVAVDHGRHFRLGVSGKVYRGHTAGDPLGAAPSRRTRDRWINLAGEFTASF
ncbi:MAG TPA: hypothetical protein VFL57_03675 [Bryobacteraceae bacterium]|nr:hypothetical protein [Bryobacteraceae bacterium]